jgi:hypothetical protein
MTSAAAGFCPEKIFGDPAAAAGVRRFFQISATGVPKEVKFNAIQTGDWIIVADVAPGMQPEACVELYTVEGRLPANADGKRCLRVLPGFHSPRQGPAAAAESVLKFPGLKARGFSRVLH